MLSIKIPFKNHTGNLGVPDLKLLLATVDRLGEKCNLVVSRELPVNNIQTLSVYRRDGVVCKRWGSVVIDLTTLDFIVKVIVEQDTSCYDINLRIQNTMKEAA